MNEQIIEVRDTREKNFFRIDDVFIDLWAADVGPHAAVVYMALCRHADVDQVSWPSATKIAKKTKISRRKVLDALARLEKANIINGERHAGRVNKYRLIDRSAWGHTIEADQCMPCTSAPRAPDQCTPCTTPVQEVHTPSYISKETQEGNTRRASKATASPDALRLAMLLLVLIIEKNKNTRLASLSDAERIEKAERWAVDIDLLLRKDRQQPSIVEEVTRHAIADNFWGKNILSGESLRRNWDKLVIGMQANAPKTAPPPVKRPAYRIEERPRRTGTHVDEGAMPIQQILDRVITPGTSGGSGGMRQ